MSPPPRLAARTAERLSVTGLVQGVGFRPFVSRLARRLGVTGWVANTAAAVEIHVEGAPADLAAFRAALPADAPPRARIERVERRSCAAEGSDGFLIRESEDEGDRRQPVAPDTALCSACEAELRDPANRRYRYPFITCTDCGPRYTVIEAMPYDRERTTMRAFTPCPACVREYGSPGERRYRSETNSCPVCGPRLWLEAGGAAPLGSASPDPLASAARLLTAGTIVAVRGLGGFHLAVDATNEAAIARLRARKHRDAKPLAIMVADLASARALAEVSETEAAALCSPEAPIVVLRRRPDSRPALGASLAPGLDTLGVMLAYTPLHALLLECTGRPLVMTSGNRADEPIATTIPEARQRLRGIADALLLHDREIVARYDDSVVRYAGAARIALRRSRGYAPLPLHLPRPSPVPLVAVGPDLKNTFTLVHGQRAFISQHIGDLESLEALDHWRASLERAQRLFRVTPDVAVRDLHPDYQSTRIAGALGLDRVIPVQHHHAHIAAVLAEHGLTESVIGIAYDGTGWGPDGTIWGGEVLLADLVGYRRLGGLRAAPMPGGDLAARTPWRAARGYLSLAPEAEVAFRAAFLPVGERERVLAGEQIARSLNAPLASSMGRLFDAAAAVLGIRQVAHFEGQAAMELECLAGRGAADPLPFPLRASAEHGLTLDPLPLLEGLGEARARGVPATHLAAVFHESVAAATAAVAERAAAEAGLRVVALGGGCFQNARLLLSVRSRLEARGLRVLTAHALSPNDGAVSFGQAAVAAAQLDAER